MADRYIRDRWQIDGSAGTVNSMMLALNVSRPIVDVQGVAVTLACPLTVMVARCASVDQCGRNRDKALLDAAHYHDLLPAVLPDGFVDLWRAIEAGDG